MIKKLVTVAVGIGLSVAGANANAVKNAGYHVALIPYVVKDTNRTTLVSIVMGGEPVSPLERLYLQYWTKPIASAHTDPCLPNSYGGIPVTSNDMLTFDTAGILGSGPLFGDVTNPAPLGTSIVYSGPSHGYLMVGAPNSNGSGNLSIEGSYWTEIDFANGSSFGDQGLNWYSDNLQYDERVLYPNAAGSSDYDAPVVFWPSNFMETWFTVTPLGSQMSIRENNQTTVQVLNRDGKQGVYDRNENAFSGTVPLKVRCVARMGLKHLMPGIVANARWNGGWGYLSNRGDGNATPGERQTSSAQGDLSAAVYQIDRQSGQLGSLSNATRIVTWP